MKRSDWEPWDATRVQQRLDDAYDAAAGGYEEEPGHGVLGDEERAAWESDVLEPLALGPGTRVLDVGTGTGIFARMLAGCGCSVVGLDPSPGMLEEARRRLALAPELAGRVEFVLGTAESDPDPFSEGSFDLVASRQVVGSLHDPLLAFGRWRRWLKPGGRVVAVDGLFHREGWNDEALVDHLPLAGARSRYTLIYLLEKAGLEVEACWMLERVNAVLLARTPEAKRQSFGARYLVLARRP